jgi:hypothetical protein
MIMGPAVAELRPNPRVPRIREERFPRRLTNRENALLNLPSDLIAKLDDAIKKNSGAMRRIKLRKGIDLMIPPI